MTGGVTHGRTVTGAKAALHVVRRDNRVHLVAVGAVQVDITITGSSALDLAGHLMDAASRYGQHSGTRG